MTRIRLFLFIFVMSVPSPAAAQGVKFEEAAAMLAASCGKDIDDNCRGVNFDSNRLKDCLGRNQDAVSAQCRADYPRAFAAIQQRVTARATVMKLCNWELKRLCSDVRQDPVAAVQCLLETSKKATPNCNKAISAAGYR